MPMPAYVIVDIQVKDPEGYQDYIKQVPAMVAKHGGKYLARGGSPKVMEGDWDPTRLVLLEFPDRESAEAFYNDPAYTEIKQIRHRTTTSNMAVFDGL